MNGLWSVLVFLVQFNMAEREPWITPLPGVSLEPSRSVRLEEDCGPESAYRLLRRAGELPDGTDTQKWLERLETQPWPAQPPQPFARDAAWPAQDYAAVRAILDRCESNLALARRAIAAEDQQFPTMPYATHGFQGARQLLDLRQVARLLVLSAYMHEGEGQVDRAMDDMLAAIRVGSVAVRGTSMASSLVDVAISRLGTESIWRVAVRNRVPVPVLRRTAAQLLEIAANVEPLAEALRYEAKTTIETGFDRQNALRGGASGGTSGERFARWLFATAVYRLTGSSAKAMERDFRYVHQHLVHLAGQPYSPEIREQVKSLAGNPKEKGLLRYVLFTDDLVGGMMVAMGLSSTVQVMDQTIDRDARLRGTAIALAIRAYETDLGRPPAQLADLAPTYLPEIPQDPFPGKPFRYIAKDIPQAWGTVTWGLYSIGRDFTDDGGKPNLGTPTKPDDGTDLVWIPGILPAQ